MRKNGGFSLVELIIAIAILSIVGIAIFGFVAFGSKAFSNSNKEVKLQYEQQVAVNQIRDLVIEAAYGLSYDEAGAPENFYIFTKDPDAVAGTPTMKVYRVRFDSSTNELYLGSQVFAVSDGLTGVIDHFTAASYDPSGEELLAENVEAFSVDLSKIKKLKVKLEFTFTVAEKSVTVKPVVALRNRIMDIDATTDLNKVIKEVELLPSFIEGVIVHRKENGKVIKTFQQNGSDTILMAGKNTSAQYDAEVKAAANSIKKYFAVSWAIEPIEGGGSTNGVSVSASGKVTITADSNVKKFKLICSSQDDPTKSTSVLINVVNTGKRPIDVELFESNSKDGVGYPIYGNGTIAYLLDARVTYEAYKDGVRIADEKVIGLDKVNVWLLDEKNPEITKGAGYNSKTGVFLATKEMEGNTYYFHVEAKDMGVDENGNAKIIERDDFSITVSGVPEKIDSPIIAVDPNGVRGGTNGVSLSWKAPDGNDEGYKPPFESYDIDWTISKGYTGGNTNWVDTDQYRSFDRVYFKTTGRTYKDNGHKVENIDNNQLYENIYCDPKLDWSRDYSINVTATCKEKKDGKYTGRTVTATKSVTFKKVEVVLKLSDDFSLKYNNNDITDYIDTDYLVGTGKNHGWYTEYNYYKTFSPTLTGITVNSLDFADVFGNSVSGHNNLYDWNEDRYNISNSSFKPYYFSGTTKKYYDGERGAIAAEQGKATGVHSIMGLDNNHRFFTGVVLTPKLWINNYLSPKLYGIEYKLTLYGKDKKANGEPVNSVVCKFVNEDGSTKDSITFRVENKVTQVTD